ncbi:MAG TPA: dTDP-4-dehydrorhamnose reductase [Candidatus Baltobacteraceae bacterium]|nr:dTDP-4-dehydrorhamnose reductase [Candidatus Baltobacteraceae bacterium]
MPLPHRVLIFGGSGQLGGEIRRGWEGVEFVAPAHTDVDITNTEAVAGAIEQHAPDVVLNCAAFHNVERCESEPHSALLANAVAVNAMAEACAARGSIFVTVSTDYVFDGELGRPYTENDTPHPISAYGVSKYAGELLVQRLQSRAYVVRTCGVYATRASTSKGHTFIDRIITQARSGEPVRIVRDQTVSPTYAPHLAQGILQLLQSNAPYGLYHVVNEGPVTWYDFASEALRVAGIDYPIEAVSYKDWPSRVRRPAFSALENAKLHALGISLPSWQDAVAAYIRDRALI